MIPWILLAVVGLFAAWCAMWVVDERIRGTRLTKLLVKVESTHRRFPAVVPERFVAKNGIIPGETPQHREIGHYVRVVSPAGGSAEVQVDPYTFHRLHEGDEAILVCRRTFWRRRIVPVDVFPKLDS